jgi:4-diphosphocytidyl-2-C-methyl-D-erythritol kinase
MSLRALYDVPAPAKLNLFLHVVGRRADGYHLLQSPFVLIDWADTLHFERRDDSQLHRHDLGPALPADDLCLRAARALQQASGCTSGVDISISKQLPWGAGIGGGSSDAASTLLALNRLWGLNWPRARLAELALPLGADLPFFIGGHNAFVEGIGEKLSPITVQPTRYALLKPQAAVSTHSIFTHQLLVRDTEPVILLGSVDSAQTETSKQKVWMPTQQSFGKNDLQAAAENSCQEVRRAADFLLARFGNSRMTGSGSAVFSRLETGSSDDAVAAFLATEWPVGWVGRICCSLSQHPLRAWAD